MKLFITILTCLTTTFTFCQSLTDKYLHYKTDYFWDTTLYKSEQDFYYEINNGRIIQKKYPVLQYLFSSVISKVPLVTKDSLVRQNFTYYPYKYIKKESNIYLQYFDLGKQKLRLNKEYSLNISDTVKWLADKNSLDSKNGISVGGFSIFLGEAKIEINGKTFKTYRFLEDRDQLSSHPSYHTREVFLDKSTLIPVKFVTTNYDYKTKKRKLYYSVTTLMTSSNILQDYTNKKTEDLIIYEQKSTTWTEKQKSIFLT
jgi:hypothetical protein